MLTWSEFAAARPLIAQVGRELFYEHGLGLGFLATTRRDGGPRVHPVCPLLNDEGLYAFVVPGPKLEDLRRDGRYALHSETVPPPRQDDAFYLTGVVDELDRPDLRSTLTEQLLRERDIEVPWPGFEKEALIEFRIERCLLTLTQARGGLPSGHTVWQS